MIYRVRHILAALSLHALLFLVLSISVRCAPAPQPPAVISGVLLDPSREQRAQSEREKLERVRLQREQEAREAKKAEEARLQAEAEHQRVEAERQALEKQKTQLEARKREEAQKKRALETQKKKEDMAQKAAAEKRKQKMEQQKKTLERQRALEKAEQDLRAQTLEADAQAAESSAAQRVVQSALDQWIALVAAQVRRNWLRPPDVNEPFECVVQIEQLPGGQIVSRKMVQSCGNKLLDDSVLKAVDKSNPLPLVTNPSAFLRSFTFKFIP